MTIRVLICDDQALVRDGFRMILNAEEDIDVIGEAADGVPSSTTSTSTASESKRSVAIAWVALACRSVFVSASCTIR